MLIVLGFALAIPAGFGAVALSQPGPARSRHRAESSGHGSGSSTASVIPTIRPTADVAALGGGSERYVDPVGWSVSYPRSMHVETSTVQGFVTVSEVTIATFRPSTGVRSSRRFSDGALNVSIRVYPPTHVAGRFPRDAVAFRIVGEDGGPGPVVRPHQSRLPVQLGSFRPSVLGRGVRFNATTGETTASSHYGGVPPSVHRTIQADGRRYSIIAWIGPDGTPAAKIAPARLISTLSFPPPKKPPYS